MTIQEVAALIDGTVQTKTVDTSREVTCGYTCDLLSWVMAKGREGMAWATVQAHMNVVAVAVLADMSCVIAAEGVQFGADVIEKAEEEGVALITTDLSAYHVAGPQCTKRASPDLSMCARIKCLALDHDDTVVMSSPDIHYPSFVEAMRLLRPRARRHGL